MDSEIDALEREDYARNWPQYWGVFWDASGIPLRHRVAIAQDGPFATINDRGGKFSESIRVAMEYAIEPRDGLMLIGKPGCGKTLLAASILYGAAWRHALSVTSWQLVPPAPRLRFESIPHILQEIRGTYSGDGTADAIIGRASWASLAVLDDIGAESPTEWVRDILYQIVDNRYTAMLPTVITSNHNLQELEARLSVRICDRIVEMCVGSVHNVTVPSFRMAKAEAQAKGKGK